MLTKKLLSTLLLATLTASATTSVYAYANTTSITEKESHAPLIAMNLFFNERSISDIQLSPDGKWIAFFKELDGARNLFLAPEGKGLSQAFAVTQSKEPIKSFQWSTSGNNIFLVKDEGGSENTQIYRLTFDSDKPQTSAEITALTNNPDVTYRILGQVKEVPNRLVVMSNHDNAEQQDIFHLDTRSGRLHKVVDNQLGFSDIKYDSAGMPVIAIGSNIDNTQTLYVDVAGKWSSVFTTAFGEGVDLLSYDEAKQQAYIRGNIQGRDKQELLSFDMTEQTFSAIHRDPNSQSDVYDVEFNDDNEPVAVSYYGGRLRTYPLNDAFSEHWQHIDQYFTEDVEIDVKKMNKKTAQWQITVASDVTESRDYRYNAKTHQLTPLLPQTPAIDPKLLSKRQSITYKARDGVNIQAYLTLPKGQHKDLPTIVLPHGGPWARDYWTLSSGYFHPIAQLLANRGYAVLQPNFRASTGFGKHFLNAGNKNWGLGNMQHDLTDGVNYLVEQGIADKDRVGIMGASYGGYAALAGITFTPDVYKASVSYVGPSSLITLLESFPPHYRPYLGQFFSAVGDPVVEKDRVDMKSRSPINFVDNIKAPLLIVQGANDPRVTQQESDNIARVMNKKGLPVEYILAKDEGHGFQKRNNKLAYVIAMEQFFAKHLGGRVGHSVPDGITQHLRSLKVDIKSL